MIRNSFSRIEELDPVRLQQQIAYIKNGLTTTSNNKNIMPRDTAGNIVLQESGSNPLLIIEPIVNNITQQSVLKVINTRFEYFKFPVTVRETVLDTVELDTDLDEPAEIIDTSNDLTLLVEVPTDEKGQPNILQTIGTKNESVWFYNNVLDSLAPNGGAGLRRTSGYKRIPFIGGTQSQIGTYEVTKDVIDRLNRSGKTLQFNLQIQITENLLKKISQNSSQFRLTELNVKLSRTMRKEWRPWDLQDKYIQVSTDINNPIDQYPFIQLSYVIQPNQLREGDIYEFVAVSNWPTYMYANNAYWEIIEIDVPVTSGFADTGIYSLSPNTSVWQETPSVPIKIISTDSQGNLINSNMSTDTTNIILTEQPTYQPFGQPGQSDGEIRSAATGQPYQWNVQTQTWNPL